jgi:hydrogenase maturation protease
MGCGKIPLFVGVGSPHGDDQAGWIIADQLRSHVDSVSDVVVRLAGVPTDLLDWLDGVDHLHLCDACQTGVPPGTLRRWEWPITENARSSDKNGPRPIGSFGALRSSGSHDWGLGQTLQLAERLRRLPPRVTLWGIEGRHFGPQDSLSTEIGAALSAIVGEIFADLSCRNSAGH